MYTQFASFSVSACDSELFKQESKWLALVNRLVSAGLSHYQPVSEQLWAHLYCRADQIVSVCFRLEDTMPAELINFFPFFVLPVSRVYGEGNLQIDLIHNTTPGHNKQIASCLVNFQFFFLFPELAKTGFEVKRNCHRFLISDF